MMSPQTQPKANWADVLDSALLGGNNEEEKFRIQIAGSEDSKSIGILWVLNAHFPKGSTLPASATI